MLIEVKAKVAWKIDGKVKKKIETYILDKEVFAEAEYEVLSLLNQDKIDGEVEDFEITGLKLSIVKEIITQYEGNYTFIATLRDTTLLDDGSEKTIKYKVLLWANNIAEAMTHTREISQQGYDMQIDGLKEVNYTYLNSQENEESESTENQLPEGA
jgi:hypothetical protein